MDSTNIPLREGLQDTIQDVKPDVPSSTIVALVAGTAGFSITVFINFIFQRFFQELPSFQLVDALQDTSRTLCFAGITASATILPLMLTIFSFARRADAEFDPWFYERIKTISWICCASFFAGLVTLVVLSAPIGDMTQVGNDWYQIFYYVIVGGLSTLVGLLAAQLVMLYYAIIHVLRRLNPKSE
jgi:hypothetical protein